MTIENQGNICVLYDKHSENIKQIKKNTQKFPIAITKIFYFIQSKPFHKVLLPQTRDVQNVPKRARFSEPDFFEPQK